MTENEFVLFVVLVIVAGFSNVALPPILSLIADKIGDRKRKAQEAEDEINDRH